MGIDDTIESCFIFSILPGKTEKTKSFFREIRTEKAAEMDEYLRSTGYSRVLVFLQHMAIGDYIVAYLASGSDIGKSFMECAGSSLPIARTLIREIHSLTGVDITRLANAPKIDMLFDWEDPVKQTEMQSDRYVFAMDILPGRTIELKRYWDQRKSVEFDEVKDHLRYQTISKLLVFLQHRSDGDFLIQYLESMDDLAGVFQKGTDPHIPRSHENVKEFLNFTGIDFSKPENIPDLELIFDWDSDRGLPGGGKLEAHA
ncbi:hypothetical protein CUJ83_08770 [Methanocella sp. CWC-04]|uniref:Uncharacterized protein n=1 Tax=Methanooceanicella nereidis TaxID=2052831 RepID=A0AAP2RD52_9EURY|nr:hypothetical protein [Methanocella sp. CWC-04]MCD1295089.1 hypothetical protein [Methanocella sp. CWC-04]